VLLQYITESTKLIFFSIRIYVLGTLSEWRLTVTITKLQGPKVGMPEVTITAPSLQIRLGYLLRAFTTLSQPNQMKGPGAPYTPMLLRSHMKLGLR
jgi:hypothetical protein